MLNFPFAKAAGQGFTLFAAVVMLASCAASSREAQRVHKLDVVCRTMATEMQKGEDWVSSCTSHGIAGMREGMTEYFSTRPKQACQTSMMMVPGHPARAFLEGIASAHKYDCKAHAAEIAREMVKDMTVVKMCVSNFVPTGDPALQKEIKKTIAARKINCDKVLEVAIPNRGTARVGAPSFRILPDGSKVLAVKTR